MLRQGWDVHAGSAAGRVRDHWCAHGLVKSFVPRSVPTRVKFIALATELLKDWVAAPQMKRSLAVIFTSSFQNLPPGLSVILDETHNLLR